MSKYFNETETRGLQQVLVDMLDNAREVAGIPFIITCGYRTPEENKALEGSQEGGVQTGAVADSAHCKGLAVDLSTPDSHTRYRIIVGAIAAGFKRIEIATAHTHLDCDTSKPQEVAFLGISK